MSKRDPVGSLVESFRRKRYLAYSYPIESSYDETWIISSWRSGDDEKAIKNYTEAIRLGPNFADAYYNRGNAYRRRGENDKAISDYTEAIRLDPNFANAYYNRGSAYRKKDDSRNAIIDYTEGDSSRPELCEGLLQPGQYLSRKQRLREGYSMILRKRFI